MKHIFFAKKTALRLLKKAPLLEYIMFRIYYGVRALYYCAPPHEKPDRPLILFESYQGKNYSCSPRVIYEAVLSDPRFDSFDKIWCFREPRHYEELLKNPHTFLCRYGSHEYMKNYKKSSIWITNCNLPLYIKKKSSQIYIQTWHGTPLKTIGLSAKQLGNSNLRINRYRYLSQGKQITFFLSPSDYASGLFQSAFGMKSSKQFLHYGYPRNDLLTQKNDLNTVEIKAKLNIPPDKKVILYAPTWRDSQISRNGETYFNNIVDWRSLLSDLNMDCILLYRGHLLISRTDNVTLSPSVLDISNYQNVSEILLITDLLVTDYSSILIDYLLLNRPFILFLYDCDEYRRASRDLYDEFNLFLPYAVFNTADLITRINEIMNCKSSFQELNQLYNQYQFNATRQLLDHLVQRKDN